MLFSISPSDRCGSGKTPLPQCAFKVSMFNVSAIHINSRSWLRSSSTHEPSDPPLRIVDLGGQIFRKFKGVRAERRAQVPRRCERPARTRFTVRLSLRPGKWPETMAPGSAFRQSLAFLFKRTLSSDHCLAKVLPGHPTPTGRTCPVKMPGVRTQTKWSLV